MARKRSGISQARSFLYGLARLLGDISAVSKGPEAAAKRIGRRAAGKVTGRALGRLFRAGFSLFLPNSSVLCMG